MKRFVVEWSPVAVADLDGILAFIATSEPAHVEGVFDRIAERAASLVHAPERGPVVPELAWHGITAYRQLTEAPWRIVYRIDRRRVVVLAVIDGRRRLEDVLLERLLRD